MLFVRDQDERANRCAGGREIQGVVRSQTAHLFTQRRRSLGWYSRLSEAKSPFGTRWCAKACCAASRIHLSISSI
jgi:hypothetical protein